MRANGDVVGVLHKARSAYLTLKWSFFFGLYGCFGYDLVYGPKRNYIGPRSREGGFLGARLLPGSGHSSASEPWLIGPLLIPIPDLGVLNVFVLSSMA